MRRRRLIATAASLCALGLLGAYFVVGAEAPGAGSGKESKFTVSTETTYITEPLTQEGYVDYVAALNRKMRDGVTAENNAAPGFIRAVGPAVLKESIREEFLKQLGIADLPERGDYFISLEESLKQQGIVEADSLNRSERRDRLEEFRDRLVDAMRRPWTPEDYPVLIDWFAANEGSLRQIVEATHRPRWYAPLVPPEEDGPLVMAAASPIQKAHCFEVGRALVARAMLPAGGEQPEKAWADLMAVHRLSRLVAQQPMLDDLLTAIALEGMANSAEIALVQTGRLSRTQALEFMAGLRSLEPLPKVVEKLNTGERYQALDAVQSVARGVREGLERFRKKDPFGLRSLITSSPFDWDIPLRMMNELYDKIVAAIGQPTRQDIHRELVKVGEEASRNWKQRKKEIEQSSGILQRLLGPRRSPEAISRDIGYKLVALLNPGVGGALKAEEGILARSRLVQIALALAAYKAESGEFPENRAELTPEYLAQVPQDPFSGEDLRYREMEDGYVLYSVGVNGRDDRGESSYREKKDDLSVHVPRPAQDTP